MNVQPHPGSHAMPSRKTLPHDETEIRRGQKSTSLQALPPDPALGTITFDADISDDMIVLVPHEYLSPAQVKELQNVLEKKKIVVLPPGRIVCGERETVPECHS